jgi:hypothetical protein
MAQPGRLHRKETLGAPVSLGGTTRQPNFGQFVKTKDFDQVVKELSDKFEVLDSRISENFQSLISKADKADIGKLTADKVKKSELGDLLPDIDVIEARIKNYVTDMFSEASRKQSEQFRTWEQKLILMRKEIDVEGINRRIHEKANAESVDSDLANHEFKISTLDGNVLSLAEDLNNLTSMLGKMKSNLSELQEANKDVLLGKKTFNCLSCGTNDGLPSKNFIGKNGQMYKTYNN